MSFCLIDSERLKHLILHIVSNFIDFHKIAIVIKNNVLYGHGLLGNSKLASNNGIKHAVVINCKKANLVKDFFDLFWYCQIQLMNLILAIYTLQ